LDCGHQRAHDVHHPPVPDRRKLGYAVLKRGRVDAIRCELVARDSVLAETFSVINTNETGEIDLLKPRQQRAGLDFIKIPTANNGVRFPNVPAPRRIFARPRGCRCKGVA
jgi:hypothetical protein